MLKVELHFQGIFHLAYTVTDLNQRADLSAISLVVATDQLKTAVARHPEQSAQKQSLRRIPVPKDPALFGTSSFGNASTHSGAICDSLTRLTQGATFPLSCHPPHFQNISGNRLVFWFADLSRCFNSRIDF